ncbi:hypothetical protein [Halosimplex carlsbadense]|uniref:hypothetical protein n=1 Tax=Halosimplex carlsbadense TaxID=171164 RepID=UPI001268E82F|nr:hypothetical protein [Halosimplex carlsbadense]
MPTAFARGQVARGLSRVDTVKARAVAGSLDGVPDGRLRAVRDAAGERATVQFAARYGRSGVDLLEGLNDRAAGRLAAIRADRAFQRRLVESYDTSPDVSAADVGAGVRRYRSYDGLRAASYTNLVRRGGPRAVDALGAFDDDTLKRFLDASAGYNDQRLFVQVADDDAAGIVDSFDEETLTTYLDAELITRESPLSEP